MPIDQQDIESPEDILGADRGAKNHLAASGSVPNTLPTPTTVTDTNSTAPIWYPKYKTAPTASATNPHQTRRRGPQRSTTHPTSGNNSSGNNPVNSA